MARLPRYDPREDLHAAGGVLVGILIGLAMWLAVIILCMVIADLA